MNLNTNTLALVGKANNFIFLRALFKHYSNQAYALESFKKERSHDPHPKKKKKNLNS
jgi:hypothetical protein